MEKLKNPLRYGQNPSGMGTRHFILEDILPVLTAKGMFMRNWMVCFSLMTRRAKTKCKREKQQCIANCNTYQVRANQRVHERDGRYQKESSQGYGFERLDADVC